MENLSRLKSLGMLQKIKQHTLSDWILYKEVALYISNMHIKIFRRLPAILFIVYIFYKLITKKKFSLRDLQGFIATQIPLLFMGSYRLHFEDFVVFTMMYPVLFIITILKLKKDKLFLYKETRNYSYLWIVLFILFQVFILSINQVARFI